jgi:D-cysteine desulfhydrase
MTETLDLHLRRMPRVALLDLATPIQRLRRIEAALGEQLNGIGLFVKRDDVMGLGGGGNKLRKLEFLLGDAIAQGADTIITVGGRQSNHARLTAAAAARYGLHCELVLGRVVARDDEDSTENGNIILDDLFGATIHDVVGNVSTLAVAEERAEVLRASGRKVYVAPTGGSSSVGCLGYAACASEIAAQSAAQDIHFQHIIVPNGSGGMHAGLSAGFAVLGAGAAKVKSFAVLARVEDARRGTLEKINATLALLESPGVSPDEVNISGAQLGEGYGIPTEAMKKAVRLMARQEGLLLDPVYSGKAFAGLLDDIANGALTPGQNVLFIMSGGTPALFAYRKEFRPDE